MLRVTNVVTKRASGPVTPLALVVELGVIGHEGSMRKQRVIEELCYVMAAEMALENLKKKQKINVEQ